MGLMSVSTWGDFQLAMAHTFDGHPADKVERIDMDPELIPIDLCHECGAWSYATVLYGILNPNPNPLPEREGDDYRTGKRGTGPIVERNDDGTIKHSTQGAGAKHGADKQTES